MSDIVLLIMAGDVPGNPVERMVAEARNAAVMDTVDRALTVQTITRIVVATSSTGLAERLAHRPVIVDRDSTDRPFHFGQRLSDCICRHRMDRIIYMGGGSGVLFSAEMLDQLAHTLLETERCAIANNFYSTDFAAWTPASHPSEFSRLRNDNGLGWMLREDCGLPVTVLERNAATQFDIDTPVDLLLVRDHPATGPHLRQYLDTLSLSSAHLERARPHLADSRSEVIVAGRIGAGTWAYLERNTACRVRVFSEERGMRSDGRLERREVRSILGFLMERNGLEKGFALLAELGDAAFIDSRVLLAHFGCWPSTNDRFLSDLGRIDLIENEWLKLFTAAAFGAPIPVVLGGHSLVSGGMYALVEPVRAMNFR